MGKTKPKRQNYSQHRHDRDANWTVKPLNENPISENFPSDYDDGNHNSHKPIVNQEESDDFSDDLRPETSSSIDFTPSKGRKPKWVSKNRGAQIGNAGFGPEHEVGGSSFGEIGGGQVVDERENKEERENERIEGVDKGKGVVIVDEEEKEEVRDDDDDNGSGGDYDDVLKKLEVLQIGVEEVELSEEQLKINDQLQQDELLAMESIYGDNVYILEKQAGLRFFQIHVHLELPSEYSVSAKLNHASSKVDVPDDFSYTFKVQYLSPIVLTCLLPRSYPSSCQPSFTVSVQWLHGSKISMLCSMLDTLWNEQPGQEILYLWVEWLHSSLLSYLGFGEELVLGPYGLESNSDRRALSGSVSPDVDIPSLRIYNEERQHENFLSGFHQCCICFSEFAGTEFLRLPCHHFFCVTCMKTYADVHVKDGTVNKLQCPTTKCGGMIPPGLLKRLLGDEEFERWESLMLQKTLDAMSDVSYCPRCETACLEDEDHHAQCSKCLFSFCSLCRERRHVGIECMTPEAKLRILKERQNSSSLQDAQKKKERELINELLSVKEILRDAKQCPVCNMAISKIEGCNKMVCSNCGQFFCYRCNKKIDGYDHFREGGCELFPQDMIQQWEEQINDRQRIAQARDQLNLNAAHPRRPCPTCHQAIAKLGNNNHIYCWSCQTHYCYLCGKVVRRTAQHFGPKGCKQHS